MTDEQRQNRLPELRKDALTQAQSDLLRQIESTRGHVPTPFRIWLQNPELAAPMHELGGLLSRGITLTTREREIAILLIAREWAAHYVLANHMREAKGAGLPETLIEDVCAGRAVTFSDPREQSIAMLVNNFVQKIPTNDSAFDQALTTLGHAGFAELLILCGYFTSVGLAMKLYQMPISAGTGSEIQ